jgi:hypothetical protein
MTTVACDCGMVVPMEAHEWPLRCACGRFYESPTSRPVLLQVQQNPPPHGPGTELKRMLQELGIEPSKKCGCEAKAAEMNLLGVEGCQREREKILAWLREAYHEASILSKLTAGATALWQRKPKSLAGMLDEAIARAIASGS